MNKINSTILECPICFDYYEDPRILTNCGHTLCTKCIIDLISTNTDNIDAYLYIDCPTCSETTIIKNGDIGSLKINYTVSSIIDSLKKIKVDNNTSLSTSCPNPATHLEDMESIYVLNSQKNIKDKIPKNIDISQTTSKPIDIPNNMNSDIDNIIFDIDDNKIHRSECCNLLNGPFSAPK